MTFGPAMAASIFEPPRSGAPRDVGPDLLEAQRGVLARLDAILDELRARP